MSAKAIKSKFRMSQKKFLYLMEKSKNSNPPGKHKRTFVFTPDELGLEADNQWKERRQYTALVDNFINVNNLKGKELKEAKEQHFRLIRDKIKEELRESMKSTIVIPEAYNPEGTSTVDLTKLTTAGAE